MRNINFCEYNFNSNTRINAIRIYYGDPSHSIVNAKVLLDDNTIMVINWANSHEMDTILSHCNAFTFIIDDRVDTNLSDIINKALK